MSHPDINEIQIDEFGYKKGDLVYTKNSPTEICELIKLVYGGTIWIVNFKFLLNIKDNNKRYIFDKTMCDYWKLPQSLIGSFEEDVNPHNILRRVCKCCFKNIGII